MAKIGFILDDLFEESEFRVPYEAVQKAGHEPIVIGTVPGKQIKSKSGKDTVRADRGVVDIGPATLDALVIPGGYSPDHLRTNHAMVTLVSVIANSGKPLAAICHGPSILIDAGVVDGHTLTSYASIKIDLVNAGAKWVDREVVIDDNLITSRSPKDLTAFCDALLNLVDDRVRGQTKKDKEARAHT